MTEPAHAIFLSYASQDTPAAKKICAALRAAGIDVFFDQSELRGGDVWDRKIRHEVQGCALFIPIISANSASRHEGYFRLEWDLADQRTHMMARSRVFVVPVRLDATTEADADVPDSFRRAQWTHLPDGETPPTFVQRVGRLLAPDRSTAARNPVSAAPTTADARKLRVILPVIVAIAIIALGAYHFAAKYQTASPAAATPATTPPASTGVAFAPPPHSVAVLPFINLSGDKEQEYFSDGLTEELLNSLASIDGLQVAASASSFTFREHPDIATMARRLNVAAVLEGSVRRSAGNVRISAQLISAVTGFQLWSRTFDRNLGDVLQLQTEIATAVANALRVTLLSDVAAKVELGGTRNPAAFDAYLHGLKTFSSRREANEIPTAIEALTEAIRLDAHYALAFAARSNLRATYASEGHTVAEVRQGFDKAESDARQALTLAPELAQAYLASAYVWEQGHLDFTRANEAYRRALALAPGSVQALRESGLFASDMGDFDVALPAAHRVVVLDPLSRGSHSLLARTLIRARRFKEAVAAWEEVISLEPDFKAAYGDRGFAYYGLGDFESARNSCEIHPDYWVSRYCLAVIYDKFGRRADAEGELAALKTEWSDTGAYQYAAIYAQWGNVSKALEWLDTALRLRDPGVEDLKTDFLMDPIRQEPRFQKILRVLNFPD